MLKDFLEIKKHKTIWIEEGQGDKVEEIIHYREKSKMEKREKNRKIKWSIQESILGRIFMFIHWFDEEEEEGKRKLQSMKR